MNSKQIWTWVLAVGAALILFLILTFMLGNKDGQPALPDTSTGADNSIPDTATTTSTTASVPVENVPPQVQLTKHTVTSVASSLEIGTRFASLFESTGVGASLKSGTTYTIFVPTDGAFARVTPGVLAKMTAAEKKRLVQNHIIVGKKIDVSALYTGHMTTMSGDTVDFVALRPQEASARVGSGLVLQSYKASNGMVYLINAVLFPPEKKL